MRLLIDGDLFCYRNAASAESSEIDYAIEKLEWLLNDVTLALQAKDFHFYLSGETNFRYKIYPEYKANRLNIEKPRHLLALREYLLKNYPTTVSENCEADDLMGIAQCSAPIDTTVIVSLDKDMLMIPGLHYSWYIEGGPPTSRWAKEAKFQTISKSQGLRNFYTQLLTGDTSDNIKGAAGIGKVKAAKMLSDETLTERDMFNIVREAYGCDEAMLMNGKCLWIMQEKEKQWEFPFDTEAV